MKAVRKFLKERWKSNEGSREDHYFMDKSKKIYFFGYNPKEITKVQLAAIFKILGVKE